ncbi:MAG TPA: methyltransferase domain-containing protein [Gemmatales bacterium]|nr:methyltransferase domain-containing protein [Gemmatales bacterium]
MPQVLNRPSTRLRSARTTLARKYLNGNGIEIGALARPVLVPHAEISYYDRCTEAELAALYPHKAASLKALDGIASLESLEPIENASLDFVIACRVLEYSSNVLAAFHAMHRVLRKGGHAFLSVADKRLTADHHRPVTPLGHLAADFVHGPSGSWPGHLEEWAVFIEHGAGEDPEERLQLALQHTQRIRQHVWTPQAWMELLVEVQRGLGFELQCWQITKQEILTVLIKT